MGATGYNSFQGIVVTYTFSGDIWSQQQQILPPDLLPYSYFGSDLAFNADGTLLAVGANGFGKFFTY